MRSLKSGFSLSGVLGMATLAFALAVGHVPEAEAAKRKPVATKHVKKSASGKKTRIPSGPCTGASGSVALYGCQPDAHIVMDVETGQVLLESRDDDGKSTIDRKIQPASITKAMTMLLVFDALRSGELKATDVITFSRNAAGQERTNLSVRAGDTITVDLALKALAVHSANDAAVALAEKLGGGSEDAFVSRMNQKARSLGMSNTHFTNPSGWEDKDMYSTVRDLAVMSRVLVRDYSEYVHYFSVDEFTYDGRAYKGHNNTLEGAVDRRTGKLTGIEGVYGIKTGWFKNAGAQIATAVKDGDSGREYIIVSVGRPSGMARRDHVHVLTQETRQILAKGRIPSVPPVIMASPVIPVTPSGP